MTATTAAWSAAAVVGSGPSRRESFFFDSGADRLYGSLYGSGTRGAPAFVVCPSWGVEGATLMPWCHRLAQGVAGLGGCGLVLHWPGSQDSGGDPAAASYDRYAEACVDAAAAGAERYGVAGWSVAGLRLGAAVATLAAPALDAPLLLLAQPAFDPVAYFDDVERRNRRGRKGVPLPPGWLFGQPAPPALRDPAAAAGIQDALARFGGDGAVVAYERPGTDGLVGLDAVNVAGDWHRPATPDHAALLSGAVGWLRDRIGS